MVSSLFQWGFCFVKIFGRMKTMNRDKFEELVRQGIEAIPQRFLKKLNNVDIVIEDEPTKEQMKELKLGKGAKLFGLYQGIPQTKRGHYTWVLPDKITLFKKPIEEVALSRQGPASRQGGRGSPEAAEREVREKVKETVWHEIAHHFGMDEKRVQRAKKHVIIEP